MAMLDFDDIKARFPIDEVAQRLGIELTKSGASMRGKCPVCESTGDRNLAVTPVKGVYYCFTHGKGGDSIALVSHTLGLGAKESAQWILGVTTAKEKPKEEKPAEGFKPLDYLVYDHEAVIALGFDPDTAERLGIGFCPRGIYKGKVAIPVRLANGKLCGYVATTDCQLPPKWTF
jgi:hypothetical protein